MGKPASLALVPKSDSKFPRNQETVRPFRLWNPKEGKQYQGRNYSDRKRAHMGALIEARWAEIGTTIEVFDIRYGKLLGQYTRRIHTVAFTGE